MTMYYVISNGLHTTVITDEAAHARAGADDDEAVRKTALTLAIERFNASSIDSAGLRIVHVADTEEETEGFSDWYGDEPSDIGLDEIVFLDAAESCVNSDDFSMEYGAPASGFNVRGWHYVEPEDVLSHLAENDPVKCTRDPAVPGTDPYADLSRLKSAAHALLAALEAGGLSDAPEETVAVARVRALMTELQEVVGGSKVPTSTCDVIQTWEVAEGSAGDLTEDQRKPWKREVVIQGDQMVVSLWPATQAKEDAEDGINLLIEVNKGRPCVHIGPGVLGDNACHVHVISPNLLEVAPAQGHLQVDETKAYAGPNGPVRGQPASAYFGNEG